MTDEQLLAEATRYKMYLIRNRFHCSIRYALEHIIYEHNEDRSMFDEITPEQIKQIDRCENVYYGRE